MADEQVVGNNVVAMLSIRAIETLASGRELDGLSGDS